MGKVSLFSRAVPAVLFIVALLIVDQITKIAVDHYLPLQEPVHLLPFLRFTGPTIPASPSRCSMRCRAI